MDKPLCGSECQARRRFTMAEITLPSARPAICFEAIPITRPMSFMPWAPVWAIISLTAASISASVRGLGRYSSITATCASSASARSCRFCAVNVAADSLPCFASLESSFGRRFCLYKYFLYVAQGFKTYLVTGLHGLLDIVTYLFK